MAKKKKIPAPSAKEYNSSPFSHLKGLSVSEPSQQQEPLPKEPVVVAQTVAAGSFADEMAMLGVERINRPETDEETGEPQPLVAPLEEGPIVESDDDQFLQAMGELQVDFRDSSPEVDAPPTASARRMKQLKQGKLVPEATLDLHGFRRLDVADKLRFFLQDSFSQGCQTLLVITGRGLHSADGEPVLRIESERFLVDEGQKWVVEWGRANKQYGGAGALILFLRSQQR